MTAPQHIGRQKVQAPPEMPSAVAMPPNMRAITPVSFFFIISSLTVDIASVADFDNRHKQDVFFDRVLDPVLPLTQAVSVLPREIRESGDPGTKSSFR